MNSNKSEIKFVTIMRKDLGMRAGKMVSQGQHLIGEFLKKVALYDSGMTTTEMNWLTNGQTKITCRCESEEELLELERKAKLAGLSTYLITDAGHTEFKGVPTKTCLAIGPDRIDNIDQITGHLKLL